MAAVDFNVSCQLHQVGVQVVQEHHHKHVIRRRVLRAGHVPLCTIVALQGQVLVMLMVLLHGPGNVRVLEEEVLLRVLKISRLGL